MGSRKSFEFDAPQFFDFNLDSQISFPESQDNTFFSGLNSPPTHDDVFLKNESYENSTAAGGISGGTSTINKTDQEKIVALTCTMPNRLSKSDGAINILGKTPAPALLKINNPLNLRKRSLSESCVKQPPKRKLITALTCSRRGLCCKNKNVKTTEQMELEKIAELQRQTFKHLRENENRLKKMKLQPRPSTIPKTFKLPSTSSSHEPWKPVRNNPKKEFNAPQERLNPFARNLKFPFSKPKTGISVPQAAPKEIPIHRSAAGLLNPAMFASKPPISFKNTAPIPKALPKDNPSNKKARSVLNLLNPNLNLVNPAPQPPRKENPLRMPLKKFNGIPFTCNPEKKTLCMPFNFQKATNPGAKTKVHNASQSFNAKNLLSTSMRTPRFAVAGKENIVHPFTDFKLPKKL